MFWIIYKFINNVDPTSLSLNINAEALFNYVFSIFTLALIAFTSLCSFLYYIISLYLINKYNIEEKFNNYPRIVRIIKWSIKINTFWVFFELFLLFFSITGIIIFSFIMLDIPFKL
jgi:hypothetical protein